MKFEANFEPHFCALLLLLLVLLGANCEVLLKKGAKKLHVKRRAQNTKASFISTANNKASKQAQDAKKSFAAQSDVKQHSFVFIWRLI